MLFTLKIDMDNAVFDDNPIAELGRMISHCVERSILCNSNYEKKTRIVRNILDDDGNYVGFWEIDPEDGIGK